MPQSLVVPKRPQKQVLYSTPSVKLEGLEIVREGFSSTVLTLLMRGLTRSRPWTVSGHRAVIHIWNMTTVRGRQSRHEVPVTQLLTPPLLYYTVDPSTAWVHLVLIQLVRYSMHINQLHTIKRPSCLAERPCGHLRLLPPD